MLNKLVYRRTYCKLRSSWSDFTCEMTTRRRWWLRNKHTLRAEFPHGFAVTDPFQCSLFTVHTGPVKSRQSLIPGVTPALYRGAGGVKRAQAAENSLGGGPGAHTEKSFGEGTAVGDGTIGPRERHATFARRHSTFWGRHSTFGGRHFTFGGGAFYLLRAA